MIQSENKHLLLFLYCITTTSLNAAKNKKKKPMKTEPVMHTLLWHLFKNNKAHCSLGVTGQISFFVCVASFVLWP